MWRGCSSASMLSFETEMNINAWLSLQVITSQQAAGTSIERLRTEAHVIERHNVRLERREKTPAETLVAEVTSALYLYTHLKPSHTVCKTEVLDILVHLKHCTVCHWLQCWIPTSFLHQPRAKRQRQETCKEEEYERYLQAAESALRALQGTWGTAELPPPWVTSRLQALQTLVTQMIINKPHAPWYRNSAAQQAILFLTVPTVFAEFVLL